MQTEDFAIFSAKLTELAELYDKPLTESQQLLYFETLADIDLDFVLGGILQTARTCKFFPKPSEIRTLIQGDDEDHAERAWLEYKAMARIYGGYSSPTFTDGALPQAIVAVFGSWEGACWTDFTPEMWAAKRKEFGRVYRVMRNRGGQGSKRLVGFFERDNALRGYTEPLALPPSTEPKQIAEGEDV